MVESFNEFDEWLAIRQSFTYKPYLLVFSSETHDQFVKIFPVKLLRYMV